MKRERWKVTNQGHGWKKYERGNARITQSPKGDVMLYLPNATTAHKSVAAAKRAAAKYGS